MTTNQPPPPPPAPPPPADAVQYLETLTIGELEDLEDAAGISFGEILTELRTESFHVRTLRAVLWVIFRRSRPELTFEGAAELKLTDLETILDEPPADPTDPADAG
jgi:hypothetical protein